MRALCGHKSYISYELIFTRRYFIRDVRNSQPWKVQRSGALRELNLCPEAHAQLPWRATVGRSGLPRYCVRRSTRRRAWPRFSPGIDLVVIWGTAKAVGHVVRRDAAAGLVRSNDLAPAGQAIRLGAFH